MPFLHSLKPASTRIRCIYLGHSATSIVRHIMRFAPYGKTRGREQSMRKILVVAIMMVLVLTTLGADEKGFVYNGSCKVKTYVDKSTGLFFLYYEISAVGEPNFGILYAIGYASLDSTKTKLDDVDGFTFDRVSFGTSTNVVELDNLRTMLRTGEYYRIIYDSKATFNSTEIVLPEMDLKAKTYSRISILTSDMKIRQLVITSNPPGAEVFYDNVSQGTTPCTLNIVGQGERTVILRRAGHMDQTRTVSMVHADSTNLHVEMGAFDDSPRVFTVKTSPTIKADIYLGDKKIGESGKPITFKGIIPKGSYLTAKANGLSAQVSIAGTKPGSYTLPVTLDAEKRTLIVRTAPSKAEIKFDGKVVGTGSAERYWYGPVKTTVRVALNGLVRTDVYNLAPGTKTVDLDFDAEPRSISLEYKPADAIAKINGYKVKAGTHTAYGDSISIEVTKKGFKPHTEYVRIAAGQEARRKVALKNDWDWRREQKPLSGFEMSGTVINLSPEVKIGDVETLYNGRMGASILMNGTVIELGTQMNFGSGPRYNSNSVLIFDLYASFGLYTWLLDVAALYGKASLIGGVGLSYGYDSDYESILTGDLEASAGIRLPLGNLNLFCEYGVSPQLFTESADGLVLNRTIRAGIIISPR